jgi:hypothetical protein
MNIEQLNNMLAYRNDDVICRFTHLIDVSETEAEAIFTETLKFLYVSQQPGIFIPDELLILDEMWHNFILFTKEYHAFCHHHFGRFVHHQPASKAEKLSHKEAVATDEEAARKDFNKKLEMMMSTVYDHLGADTVIKWFSIYPEVYSINNIKKLRKI